MFTVVVSKKDIASVNIYESLQRLAPDLNFLVGDEDIIHVDTSKTDADYFVFASRHKSADKRKTLSVHLIGNWHKAEFGGEERMLSGVSSHLLKKFFLELNKQTTEAKLPYECTLEATHHGPYVKKPAIFIEIGSAEEQWKDKKAADVIAKTIVEATKKFDALTGEEDNWQTALAFGGGHYCKAFNKHELGSEYALSHICSKYNMPFVDEEMIAKAIEATQERIDLALIDWKGLAGERDNLLRILDSIGLVYEKA